MKVLHAIISLNTLINLNRLQQARPELLRAIECKQSLGHVG